MTKPEVFVGREPELEHLNRLLDLALSGKGQVCLVAGEGGAGKTSLVREFARRAQEAHQDLVVASGECNDLTGQGDPYLPFREILGSLTGDVETGLAQGSITPVNANRLRSLLVKSGQVLVEIAPDLINVIIPGGRLVGMLGKAVASRVGWLEKLDLLTKKERHEPTLGEPSLVQDRVFEECSAFLSRLSEVHPLVITLDDLQWADAASVGLLFHLGRRIGDRRILLVGAYRPDVVAQGRGDERHLLEPVLHEFMRYSGKAGIELAPGSPSESQAFVDAILDAEPNRLDDSFRRALCRHTGGHPLFTTELLRSMRERGELHQDEGGRWVARSGIDWSAFPPKAEGLVAERIKRLEETDRKLLQVASLEGDTFTAEVVARVLGREPRYVVDALSGKLDREQGLVYGTGVRRVGEQRLSSYSFRHHLVQQYLYTSMDAAQRSYLHEDTAKAIEALYGDSDETVGELAWHYREAGSPDRAFAYSIRAGDRAGHLYASSDAVSHYSSAVELLATYDANSQQLVHLFGQRGRALELSGQPRRALENYEEMETRGRQRGDPSLELAGLTARSVLLAIPTVIYDPEEGQSLADRALVLARAAGDAATEARILWCLLLIHSYSNRSLQAVAVGEQSLVIARQLGSREQLAYTLHDLSGAYWKLGESEKALATVGEACKLWDELGNKPMLANALGNNAEYAFAAGNLTRALELATESLGISRSIGNLSGVSFGQTLLGLTFRERGETAQAIAALQEAVETGEQAGNVFAITGIRAELAWALSCVGGTEDGLRLAKQALAEAEMHFPSAREWTGSIVARIHLLAGDGSLAQAAIPQAGNGLSEEHLNEAPLLAGGVIGLAAGELALFQGEPDLARTCMERLITHLHKTGARIFLAEALQVQSKAFLSHGEIEAARRALQDAKEVALAVGSRRTLWTIFDALADIEASHGDAELSRRLRTQAIETVQFLADHMGESQRRSDFLRLPRVEALLAHAPAGGPAHHPAR